MYFIIFFISTFLLYLSEKDGLKKGQKGAIILIALALPCFMAGMRGGQIGTDLRVYARPLSELALENENFFEYMNSKFWASWHRMGPSDYELGFSVLVWVLARVTGSLSGILFGIEAAAILPFYYAARKYLKGRSVWLSMAVYYFMLFNVSLNMMRQMIAMGFALLAFAYWSEGKIKKTALSMLVSTCFHGTALTALVMLVLTSISEHIKNRKLLLTGVVLVSVFILATIKPLAQLMSSVGLTKYAAYLLANPMDVPWVQLFEKILILLIVLIGLNGMKGSVIFSNSNCTLYIALVMSLVLCPIGSLSPNASRILLYFDQGAMLLIPVLLNSIDEKRGHIKYVMISLLLLATYWVIMFGIFGVGETVPYAIVN